MASNATPNGVVPSMLSSGWLTFNDSVQQATGHVAVTSDNDATIPNPEVPINDGVVDYDPFGLDAGAIGEGWIPTGSFPWPALASSGNGVVAVTPGMTGNGNDNDDPTGMPGYDGPTAKFGGAYSMVDTQTGYDAVAQQTDNYGFNVLRPDSNMGYQRTETRLIGNSTPGYVNIWNKIWNVSPMVKTANQFTAQPFTNMDGTMGTLPAYADLGLANSGGPAYFVNGPEAPSVSNATPTVSGSYSPDPAAGWA